MKRFNRQFLIEVSVKSFNQLRTTVLGQLLWSRIARNIRTGYL